MPLIYEKQGAVATFRIDNGKVNVFTPEMHRELYEALTDFVSDTSVHVGIMTGAQGRSFCAGDDIKNTLPELTPNEAMHAQFFPHSLEGSKGLTRPGWEQDVMRMARYKPIIGAVDGYCLGQGMIYLLLLTDIRIATPQAKFGLPEIAYAMAGASGLARIGRHLPRTVAMEMLLLGEQMDAPRARETHLINRIVEREHLQDEAMRLAKQIARHPPIAVRIEMETYEQALDMSREQATAYAATLFRLQRIAYEGYGAGTGFFRAQ